MSIFEAIAAGDKDALRGELDRGAAPDVVARNATIVVTPLHSAAAGAHSGIVKLLLEAGALRLVGVGVSGLSDYRQLTLDEG